MAIEGFTYATIRTPAQALAAAEACGPHVGLRVDTLHVRRTGGSWADIAALPPERIHYFQISGGPLLPPGNGMKETMDSRMAPGTGEFDLAALMPLIPPGRILSVEAPFAVLGMAPLDRARGG